MQSDPEWQSCTEGQWDLGPNGKESFQTQEIILQKLGENDLPLEQETWIYVIYVTQKYLQLVYCHK